MYLSLDVAGKEDAVLIFLLQQYKAEQHSINSFNVRIIKMKIVCVFLSFSCLTQQLTGNDEVGQYIQNDYVNTNGLGLNDENIYDCEAPLLKRSCEIDWNKDLCGFVDSSKLKLLPVTDSDGNMLGKCGKTVLLQRFEKKPRIGISALGEAFRNKKLTLIMIDPDAPSKTNPKCRSWLHWMVTNIKGGDGSTGNENVEFNAPTPPKGSGLHRYIFLLFEQSENLSVVGQSNRCGFHVGKFVKNNNLKGPIALNMFRTQTK